MSDQLKWCWTSNFVKNSSFTWLASSFLCIIFLVDSSLPVLQQFQVVVLTLWVYIHHLEGSKLQIMLSYVVVGFFFWPLLPFLVHLGWLFNWCNFLLLISHSQSLFSLFFTLLWKLGDTKWRCLSFAVRS